MFIGIIPMVSVHNKILIPSSEQGSNSGQWPSLDVMSLLAFKDLASSHILDHTGTRTVYLERVSYFLSYVKVKSSLYILFHTTGGIQQYVRLDS